MHICESELEALKVAPKEKTVKLIQVISLWVVIMALSIVRMLFQGKICNLEVDQDHASVS